MTLSHRTDAYGGYVTGIGQEWRKQVPLYRVGLAAFGAALAMALVALWLLPNGYLGGDDFEYVNAALRWLDEGPYPGTDHWETRLPYVLSLALAYKFSSSTLSLFIPNILAFCCMVAALCVVAFRAFGVAPAVWTGFLLFCSPYFVRRATILYPEMMETGLGIVGLAIAWLAANRTRGRTLPLMIAGVFAAIAFMIRQTALSLSLAFSVWVLIRYRRDLRRAISIMLPYASGAGGTLLAEALFYTILTGDPLWRLKVDLGHVLVPSSHLYGSVFTDGIPLFNTELSARWQVPSIFNLHWTIAGIGHFFLDPGQIVFVLLGLFGIALIISKNHQENHTDIAIIVLLTLFFQWILNNFVMSLAPNARYFTNAAAMMFLPAGYFLASLPKRVRIVAVPLLLLYLAVVLALQPSYASVDARVRQAELWAAEGSHHMGKMMARRTLLLRLSDPVIAERLLSTEPPIGGTLIDEFIPSPDRPENRCVDGTSRWELVDSAAKRSRAGDLMRWAGLDRLVGERAAELIDSKRPVFLLRRTC